MKRAVAVSILLAACETGGGGVGGVGGVEPRPDAATPTEAGGAGGAPHGLAGPDAGTSYQTLHFAPNEDSAPAVALALGEIPKVSVGAEAPEGAAVIEVEADPACRECFELSLTREGGRLKGGAPLGLAHGIAEALERAGFGLHHPLAPVTPPDAIALPAYEVTRAEPAIARRGLHLHTLHPIEALDAYWIPGETQLDRAKRINRWIAWNGGNFVEWVALNDIQLDPARHAAWVEHTRAIVEDAHARGMETGLGIQLFGLSNLQKAFDLIDDPDEMEATRGEQIGTALDLVTGVGLDVFNLSFGEFLGAEPDLFVDSVNLTWSLLQARAPEAEMVTTIHVGNDPEQRITYRGQEMLYYFLAQFADPAVVPWVHTVMFYNLYDPAGGAYEHEEFTEHREFTEARLAAGEPVGYFPETAYWIAFDNTVPQFLPVYVTSRLLDLDRLLPQGDLAAHVLFSSGWEWGYWMHDRASLRASYRGEAAAEELFTEAYGARVAPSLTGLGARQREELILKKAAPYTAVRDIYIDLGDAGDIIAAPDRLSLAEVAALPEPDRAAFERDVLGPLDALRQATTSAKDVVENDDCGGDGCGPLPFPRVDLERLDGLIVNKARLDFVLATYRAALAHARAEPTDAFVAEADTALRNALVIVQNRHAHRWDAESPWITERWDNPTIYQYGYLHHTNTLCHWQRERLQLQRLLTGAAPGEPGCAL